MLSLIHIYWVYGILVKGKHVVAGDKVSIDDVLVIQVGNGKRSRCV